MIVIDPPSSGTGNADAFAGLRKTELARFLLRAKRAAGIEGEVTVLLCGDRRIQELNRTFRAKNKSTDVLSFPAGENAEGLVGDLAVSIDTAARQAAEHGHTLDKEVRILLLHGVLHLAGLDHECDSGEMHALESELRAKLKLPNGLIERSVSTRDVRKPALKTGSKATTRRTS